MTLYIYPTQTFFPTTSVLTTEAIQYMVWLGFSGETTDEQIEAAGFIPVTSPAGTQPDDTTLIVDKNQNGEYHASWVDNTAYQQTIDTQAAAGFARARRNILLQQTDWTQAKDISDETSSKYTTYRQALRDITTQQGFPTNIVWPVIPN